MIFYDNNKPKENLGRFLTAFFLKREKITNHKNENAFKYNFDYKCLYYSKLWGY